MSALVNFSINVEEINKLGPDKLIKGKKGTYVNLTLSVNNETKYGNNASVSISQKQEPHDIVNRYDEDDLPF